MLSKLYQNQYGFRDNHSTINAITELVYSKIMEGFDERQ